MKRYNLLIGLFIGVLLWMPTTISAQLTFDWEVMVFDQPNTQITRIGSTGDVISIHDLPLPPSSSISTYVSISPSGNRVAYTAYNPNLVYLNIYDLTTDRLLTSPIITPPNFSDALTNLEFTPIAYNWSDDETRIALGVVIDNAWSVRIYDTANGNLVSELLGGDPRIPERNQGLMPLPLYMTNESVSFALIYMNAGGALEYPAYQWNYITQDVVTDARVRTPNPNVFERTGEVLQGISDYSLPNQSGLIQGPGGQNNTLHIGFPNSTITQAVIVDGDHSFHAPHFIQNGELIATFRTNMFTNATSWDVYDRNGVRQGNLQIGDFIPSIQGLSDGFVYSAELTDIALLNPNVNALPDITGLVYVNTRDGFAGDVGQLIWTGAFGNTPRLVWARDNRANLFPLPATAWANIGISITDYLAGVPLPVASPSFNAQTGAFIIGGLAEINTTAGDRANMRQDAGVGFSVVEQLANGVQVQIIGGPIDDGVFTWWQIRAPSGQQGWVVQSADGVQVLIPFATGSASTPTMMPPVASGSLQIGGRAFVTSDGDNINMRDAANTSAPVVRILSAGTIFDIVGGGFTNEGYTWWQIRYEGITGWVAQGTITADWIAPTVP